MLKRKRRGTLAQELGKTIGGVCACMGTALCLKAMQDPLPPGAIVVYHSAFGDGDLYAPFPPEHVLAISWIGLGMAIGGTVVRLVSHWGITSPKEEES
jgi:hypothetical protein